MNTDNYKPQVNKHVASSFTCIFDLDGVLVNTNALHIESWQAVADKLKVVLPERYDDLTRGLARNASLKVLLDHHHIELSEAQMNELCHLKNDLFLDLVKEKSDALLAEGARSLLDALKQANVPCAIASSSNNARAIAENLKIAGYFSLIVEARDVYRTKPHVESFIRAARELQFSEHRCIVLEDSDPAIESANNQGFITIGIGKKSYLQSAQYHFNSLNDMDMNDILTIAQNG